GLVRKPPVLLSTVWLHGQQRYECGGETDRYKACGDSLQVEAPEQEGRQRGRNEEQLEQARRAERRDERNEHQPARRRPGEPGEVKGPAGARVPTERTAD